MTYATALIYYGPVGWQLPARLPDCLGMTIDLRDRVVAPVYLYMAKAVSTVFEEHAPKQRVRLFADAYRLWPILQEPRFRHLKSEAAYIRGPVVLQAPDDLTRWQHVELLRAFSPISARALVMQSRSGRIPAARLYGAWDDDGVLNRKELVGTLELAGVMKRANNACFAIAPPWLALLRRFLLDAA